MTQYALMWSKLSSISRATATFFRSSKAVVGGSSSRKVFSEWKASGMKAENPVIREKGIRPEPVRDLKAQVDFPGEGRGRIVF